jgi:protein TonB
MGSSARVGVGGLLAIPVAIGLFYLMQALVDRDYKQEDTKARKIADIVVPDKVIETNLKEVKPEKVEDPEEPPPDLEPIDFDTDIDMNVANTAPNTGINLKLSSSGMSSGDGEYLPIVKVAPIYPRRAQTRGISGYCIVAISRGPGDDFSFFQHSNSCSWPVPQHSCVGRRHACSGFCAAGQCSVKFR